MAFNVPNIATAGVAIVPNTEGFADRLKKSIQKPLERLGPAGQLAVGAIAAIGTAAIAAGQQASKAFGEFELQMSRIEGLVGVAGDEVDRLGDEVLALAGRTGKGPKELAEALFFITSAGLEGAEATAALEQAARASAAGLGDMTAIADALTSAMNAYGPETLSAAEATNILVAAVREGKLEASELAGVVGRVIPIASSLGVEFDEVAGLLAAMSRSGTSASEGVTALRGIMGTLIKPSAEAQQVLAAAGLSFEQLRQQAADEGLLAALLTMRDVVGDNEAVWGQLVPNVEALTGVLNLLGPQLDSTRQIVAAVGSDVTAADKAFEAFADTIEGQLAQATAGLEADMIAAGEAASEGFAPLELAFLELRREVQPALARLGGAIAEIAAPLVDLAVPAGRAFGDVLEALVPPLKIVAQLLKVAASVIKAVVVPVFNAVSFAARQFGDAMEGILGPLQTITGPVIDALGGFANWIGDAFSTEPPEKLTEAVTDTADVLGRDLIRSAASGGDALTDFAADAETSADVVSEAFAELKTRLADDLADSVRTVDAAFDEFIDLGRAAADAQKQTAEDIVHELQHQLEAQANFAANLRTLTAAGLDDLVEELVAMGPQGAAAAAAFAEDISAAFDAELLLEEAMSNELTAMLLEAQGLQTTVATIGRILGEDIASGFLDGLRTVDPSSAMSDWLDANRIVQDLGSRWEIRSPSQVMAREIGAPLAEGVIAGWSQVLADGLPTIPLPPISPAATTTAGGTGGAAQTGGGNTVVVNLHGFDPQDSLAATQQALTLARLSGVL